ncbi:MAG TPA: MBL fold metallo-hydrolase [Paracoccaceae bacterium]|nr:MBL fold metallo-hydrolase [Paracoccaceae bacterium]
MSLFLCATCGTLFPDGPTPPAACPICEDARQWVPGQGQSWTTLEALQARHFNAWRKVAPGLIGLSTQPAFAIGQRAFLVQTPHGNLLWDCISLFDEATRDIIAGLGGLKAIALSHPHYYGTMALWAAAFDCPVYLHEADREWLVRPDPRIVHWRGERLEPLPGLVLHNFGGHFPGSSVLHWEAERRLLVGDTVLVTLDGRHVAFMWSYPNYVPLPAAEVARLAARFEALDFEALHSAFWDRSDILSGAKEAVRRSAERCLNGPGQPFTLG